MALVELKNLSRVYVSGDHEQKALDEIDLSIDKGKFVVILGPSGAGKSTLLNLLGGLDSPTSGSITVDGKPEASLALTVTENEKVSFFKVTSGEEYDPESTDKICLSEKFAAKNDIKLGDEVTLKYKTLSFFLDRLLPYLLPNVRILSLYIRFYLFFVWICLS